MMSSLFNKLSAISELIRFRSLASKRRVSSSLSEPIAKLKKFKNSFLDFLPAPSAMLEGIETAALRICEVSPYFSFEGNSLVIRYISLTKVKAIFPGIEFCTGFVGHTKF